MKLFTFLNHRKMIAVSGGRYCHFFHFLDEELKTQKEVGTQLEKEELEQPRLWALENLKYLFLQYKTGLSGG